MNEINHLCLSQFHLCQSVNLRILECQSPKIYTQGKGHMRPPKCGDTNGSGFRAYSVHASRLLQQHQLFSKSREPRSCFANRSTRQTPKLFSAHPLMSSWIYSRHKTQVGLLSRHFLFFDAGSFGANSECVKDQQHYRGPALADLQTGAQIPLWPQEKRQFSRNIKGKI